MRRQFRQSEHRPPARSSHHTTGVISHISQISQADRSFQFKPLSAMLLPSISRGSLQVPSRQANGKLLTLFRLEDSCACCLNSRCVFGRGVRHIKVQWPFNPSHSLAARSVSAGTFEILMRN